MKPPASFGPPHVRAARRAPHRASKRARGLHCPPDSAARFPHGSNPRQSNLANAIVRSRSRSTSTRNPSRLVVDTGKRHRETDRADAGQSNQSFAHSRRLEREVQAAPRGSNRCRKCQDLVARVPPPPFVESSSGFLEVAPQDGESPLFVVRHRVVPPCETNIAMLCPPDAPATFRRREDRFGSGASRPARTFGPVLCLSPFKQSIRTASNASRNVAPACP